MQHTDDRSTTQTTRETGWPEPPEETSGAYARAAGLSADEAQERDGAPPADAPPLLASRRFMPLFGVLTLGAFNDNVFKAAFVALITYRLADQLEMSVALLGVIASGLFILPFALFAPIAGEIADRVDKAAMMRVVKIAEVFLMIGATIAFFAQTVFILYVLLFLMGVQSAFFSPIKYGVLPQYLWRDELVRGNGFIQAATFLAILIGTNIGTNLVLIDDTPGDGLDLGVLATSTMVILVALAGVAASWRAPSAPPAPGMAATLAQMATAAARFLRDRPLTAHAPFAIGFIAAAAGVLVFGPTEGPLADSTATLIAISAVTALAFALLWPSMRDSVAVAQTRPVAWRAILAIAWFWFVGATFMSLLPAYAKERLHGDETVFSVLLTTFSVGVALGAVLTGLLFKGRVRVSFAPYGALMIAVFSIDLYFATEYATFEGEELMTWTEFLSRADSWRVLLDFMMLAVGAGVYLTPLNAVYQNAAPEDGRGRVVATSNMIDSAFMVVSAIVVALLLSFELSTEEILAALGGSGVIAAFVVAREAPDTALGRLALSIWPRRGDP